MFLNTYASGSLPPDIFTSMTGPSPVPVPVPPPSAYGSIIASDGEVHAPNPPDESDRQRETWKYQDHFLGAGGDQNLRMDFERYVQIATRLTSSKVGNVSFFDAADQYILGEVVQPSPLSTNTSSETVFSLSSPLRRSTGICAHALLHAHLTPVYTISDMSLDWRFREKPFVTGGLRLRAYMGAPIYASGPLGPGSERHALGVLCVLDDKPRNWTQEEQALLRHVADMVAEGLESRRGRRMVGVLGVMAEVLTEFTAGGMRGGKAKAKAQPEPGSGESDKKAQAAPSPELAGKEREAEADETVWERACKMIGKCLAEPFDVDDVAWIHPGENKRSEVWHVLESWHDPRKPLHVDSHSSARSIAASAVSTLFEKENAELGVIIDAEELARTPALQFLFPPTTTALILVPVRLHRASHTPHSVLTLYTTHPRPRLSSDERAFLYRFASAAVSEQERDKLAVADAAKALFISNVSHELRSPLHGVLASAEMLEETGRVTASSGGGAGLGGEGGEDEGGGGGLSVEQRGLVRVIRSCGGVLLEVINSVLDFGKIARGGCGNSTDNLGRRGSRVDGEEHAVVDLVKLSEEVVESCFAGFQFRSGNVNVGNGSESLMLLFEMNPTTPSEWRFHTPHSAAIRRVLMNLITNALKYTPNSPTNHVRVTLSKTSPTSITLTVEDSGRGISPDFIKQKLFQAFQQEDPLAMGAGLGMSICKSLVRETLGGDIEVGSSVGKGTKVLVRFNLRLALWSGEELPYEGLDAYRVWVEPEQEREEVGITPGEVLLEQFGARSRAAEYLGGNVVQEVEEADILLVGERSRMALDEAPKDRLVVMLCSVTERKHLSADMRRKMGENVVVVTVPHGPGKVRAAVRAGLERIHRRGEGSPTLTSAVVTAMNEISISYPPETPTTVTSFATTAVMSEMDDAEVGLPSVLVVEDNPINAMLLKTWLKKNGYPHYHAANGQIAVDAVKKKFYPIVLMDVQMPVKDGFDATRDIRQIESEQDGGVGRRAKIVALTGLDTPGDVKRAYECGVDEFLTKPVSLKKLGEILKGIEKARLAVG
ncbi:hypothetical protein SAICODRAFT_28142 [Saitoella complicata NRRL Y-17804]|nr:uncharacterized protein SAICODRAFT_28142 [Saitoella complicata NRRL Y-17804]ODQ49803.1 hypothetical protein SAICODRAFT_28142 [Saitoella complicata NRRL Y-17804]